MPFRKENDLERAILIGIDSAPARVGTSSYWIEFEELVRTAGAQIVGRIIQARDNPDPALFIGSGKAEELAQHVKAKSAGIIISARELSPVQVHNLTDLTGVRVIDRTGLILDIFAQRAWTSEGKLQVELAQLNYFLPRLNNSGYQFSRLGGGIGTRGPGETKLEADRRRIRKRITDLKKELSEVETHRMVQRQLREKNQVPTIALVGYTNAGKSTLFNRLTNAGVPAQERLFDTLDPISRLIKLPNNQEVLVFDTVGFISDLPHQLVAAFKATLEETIRSTILLLVMDASSHNLVDQYAAVRSVLVELGIETKETVYVLNKVDLLDSRNSINRLAKEWGAIPISARHNSGFNELEVEIQRRLAAKVRVYRMLLPFHEAGLLDVLHRKSRVLEEEFTAEGIRLLVELELTVAQKYHQFLLYEGQ